MTGHVPEIVGHGAEITGHVPPKYPTGEGMSEQARGRHPLADDLRIDHAWPSLWGTCDPGPYRVGILMNWFDALQWPAMVVTLAARWLVASNSGIGGFWIGEFYVQKRVECRVGIAHT